VLERERERERASERENVRIFPTAATLGFLGSGKEAKKILSLSKSLYALLHTDIERNYREERECMYGCCYTGVEREGQGERCVCVYWCIEFSVQ
jgi:hypothetical protein